MRRTIMENLSQLKRLALPHKMSPNDKNDKDDKGDKMTKVMRMRRKMMETLFITNLSQFKRLSLPHNIRLVHLAPSHLRSWVSTANIY